MYIYIYTYINIDIDIHIYIYIKYTYTLIHIYIYTRKPGKESFLFRERNLRLAMLTTSSCAKWGQLSTADPRGGLHCETFFLGICHSKPQHGSSLFVADDQMHRSCVYIYI